MTKRRFGRVRQLPSGRWQARYPGPDGRDRAAPVTFATKTEAARFLAATETDQARGTWLDPERSSVVFRAYAEAWLSERTVAGRPLAPRTRANYRGLLDRWLLPTLGHKPLSSLTTSAVRAWHGEVASRTGATTTRQAYALLSAVLTTAVDDGALARHPCTLRGAGTAKSPERPLYDREQAEALADGMPPHLRPLALLAFWGALRLGELLALQWGDIDFEARSVRVVRQDVELPGRRPLTTAPKAASGRTVHLSAPALEVLRQHQGLVPDVAPDARLFARANGEQLRSWDVHRYWRVAREKAGLPAAHLHDLRHAGLTLAAQSGATLAEVMRRAGHSTARAALTYQHAADRRDSEVAERMAGGDTERTAEVRRRAVAGSERARNGHAAPQWGGRSSTC